MKEYLLFREGHTILFALHTLNNLPSEVSTDGLFETRALPALTSLEIKDQYIALCEDLYDVTFTEKEEFKLRNAFDNLIKHRFSREYDTYFNYIKDGRSYKLVLLPVGRNVLKQNIDLIELLYNGDAEAYFTGCVDRNLVKSLTKGERASYTKAKKNQESQINYNQMDLEQSINEVENEASIRLNKTLRSLNISLDKAVDILSNKGIEIEARPTTKITAETEAILIDEIAKETNAIPPAAPKPEVTPFDELSDDLMNQIKIATDEKTGYWRTIELQDELIELTTTQEIYSDNAVIRQLTDKVELLEGTGAHKAKIVHAKSQLIMAILRRIKYLRNPNAGTKSEEKATKHGLLMWKAWGSYSATHEDLTNAQSKELVRRNASLFYVKVRGDEKLTREQFNTLAAGKKLPFFTRLRFTIKYLFN